MWMLLWGAISTLFIVLVILTFIGWAIHEHVLANKYRLIVKTYEAEKAAGVLTTSANQWIVKYKDGRKKHEARVSGLTESEALGFFIKQSGIRYDSIESVTKK